MTTPSIDNTTALIKTNAATTSSLVAIHQQIERARLEINREIEATANDMSKIRHLEAAIREYKAALACIDEALRHAGNAGAFIEGPAREGA